MDKAVNNINGKAAITDEEFKNEVLNSNKPVIIEISADWSGTSHITAPIIEQFRIVPNRL